MAHHCVRSDRCTGSHADLSHQHTPRVYDHVIPYDWADALLDARIKVPVTSPERDIVVQHNITPEHRGSPDHDRHWVW